MARGVNKVILIGNLGADPEVRSMSNGDSVANLSIATGETWKDKETGENKENTEWHRVVFYKALADVSGKYLKKGSRVYVEGKIRTRKWQDQSGQDRYTTEIYGSELLMLDGKKDDAVPSANYANKDTAAVNGGMVDDAIPF